MGAFLSVPVAMYFLGPSIGTYSTSLNLLFFYMVSSGDNINRNCILTEIL